MADESEQDGGESGRSGLLPESIKKALVTGISAVFMTEEGIRSALSDLRLPKEAIAYLIQQTANSRREIVRVLTDELKGVMRNADFAGTVRKVLAGMRVEVKAELRFIDENAGAKAGEPEPQKDPT